MDITNLNPGEIVFLDDEEILVLTKPIIDERRNGFQIAYIAPYQVVTCNFVHFNLGHYMDFKPRDSAIVTRLSDDDRRYGRNYLQWLQSSA